ncbi:hypothetical protein OIU85_001303 [Salix viminalis]|uniref:Uncharacterized protein n=1 Tax=Salix viminalis TaxID=40686 RepID=A0A9Q0VLQ8_SALVM|nr:hypothetical protein OIU85_001303 [Salix viminalis]
MARFHGRDGAEYNGCVFCDDQKLSEKAKGRNDRILSSSNSETTSASPSLKETGVPNLTEMMTNLVYIDGTVSIPPDDSGGPSVCQVELPPCSRFQNLFGICFREMRRRVFLKQNSPRSGILRM